MIIINLLPMSILFSMAGVRWVFAGIFGWVFAGSGGSLGFRVGLLGKNSEVARKVAHLLGRFMDVEIPVSQFPISVIAMFVLVSLIHSEELGN